MVKPKDMPQQRNRVAFDEQEQQHGAEIPKLVLMRGWWWVGAAGFEKRDNGSSKLYGEI